MLERSLWRAFLNVFLPESEILAAAKGMPARKGISSASRKTLAE
jgi:hypothetical protein